MQVTRANIQEMISIAEELRSALELAVEAAEAWESEQDNEPKDADAVREAREELDEALEVLDVTSMCMLIHGKKGHR